MSFIHCSPLFTPLMPLPMMSPEVMRKERKNRTGSTTSATKGAMKPPSTKRKTSAASAKVKGKQPAIASHYAPQAPSYTPAFAEPSHPYEFQPPYQPHLAISHNEAALTQDDDPEHEMDTNLDFSYPENADERPVLYHSSSYQEGSFGSDINAVLTFTVESQPMSDLSSSQQQQDS